MAGDDWLEEFRLPGQQVAVGLDLVEGGGLVHGDTGQRGAGRDDGRVEVECFGQRGEILAESLDQPFAGVR